jgi:hypothetical protein
MSITDILNSPVLVGVPIGLLTTWLVWRDFKRSQKADTVAAATGTIGQIYTGLNQIVENLRVDNNEIRVRVETLQVSLEKCISAREEVSEKLGAALQEKRALVRERNNLVKEKNGEGEVK